MTTRLKQKAIAGVFWTAVERYGTQGTQFILGIFLARLLTPKDFGLVGMLTIFIAISQSFVDSGFTTALIQKKKIVKEDYSTVFLFNMAVSLLFYIILFFCSGFIADFYNEPQLELLTKVIAISIVINAFGAVQRTYLTKNFDFKTQAQISVCSNILGGSTGIYFALHGFGVWALVIQSVSRNTLINLGLWVFGKWKPLLLFSIKSFKELFSYGSKLLAAGLLNTIFDNLYLLVIGKLFNAQSLGYYTRADQFQKLSVGSVYGVMQKVAFPVLSELQDDNVKLKAACSKFIRMTAFIAFPVMTVLACIAYPMVELVLTEKWMPVAPLLQIFCIYGALYPVHAINLNILNVKGRSDLFLKLEIVKKVLVIIAILITYRWGVIGLIWGLVALSVVALYLNTFYTKKLINYNFYNQVQDIFPFLVFSLISGILVCIFVFLVENLYIKFFGGVLTGFLSYSIIAYLLKTKEMLEIFSIIKTQKWKL